MSADQSSNFDEFTDDLDALLRMKASAIATVTNLSNEVGGSSLLEDQFVDEALLETVAVQSDTLSSRGAGYLAERIFSSIGKEGDAHQPTLFAQKAASFLSSAVQHEIGLIEEIVACGLDDPIEISANNVVNIQRGLSENPARLVRQLTTEHKTWLMSEEPTAPLIEGWRSKLRESYLNANGHRKDGSAG